MSMYIPDLTKPIGKPSNHMSDKVSRAEKEEIETSIEIIKTLKFATVKITEFDRSDKIQITFPEKREATEFAVSKAGGTYWIYLLEHDSKFYEVKSASINSRTFNKKIN